LNFRKFNSNSIVGTVGNIHIRAFWHGSERRGKAIALLVRKNRVLGMYKGLLVDLGYVRRGCLFILGSTGLWSSFAHEEFGPARKELLEQVSTKRDKPHAVLAIGAALGGLGVESLPFSSFNFFNSGVSGSDAIAHSAREHDQISKRQN
jgi:hypothetical protein